MPTYGSEADSRRTKKLISSTESMIRTVSPLGISDVATNKLEIDSGLISTEVGAPRPVDLNCVEELGTASLGLVALRCPDSTKAHSDMSNRN